MGEKWEENGTKYPFFTVPFSPLLWRSKLRRASVLQLREYLRRGHLFLEVIVTTPHKHAGSHLPLCSVCRSRHGRLRKWGVVEGGNGNGWLIAVDCDVTERGGGGMGAACARHSNEGGCGTR